MALYFFRADFRGLTLTDDIGEEFATARQAEAHAIIVARELARNNVQPVTVSVLTEDGELVASMAAHDD